MFARSKAGWVAGLRGQVLPGCEATACSAARRAWRRMHWWQGRIRLHGSWYCSPQCFEEAARERFERAFAEAVPRARAQQHRIPLGLLLLSRGQLTNRQLRSALEAQQSSGQRRIGEWLETLGFVSEQQITAALGLQWACPVLASGVGRDYESARLLPYRLMERLSMLPVRFVAATRVFHLAFCFGIDYTAMNGIEQMLDCRTEACLVSRSTLEQALERIGHGRRLGDLLFESQRLPGEMAHITSSYVLKFGAEDVRIVACGEYIWTRLQAGSNITNLLFQRTSGSQACGLRDGRPFAG